MPHTLINEEKADIYEFPEICDVANENIQVTIGDLHGNAMKLMFMLVKQGIATNLTKKNYDTLVEIYKKEANHLSYFDIEVFNEIVAGIKLNKGAILLIGDELADRGSNDYFTLKILEQLQKQHIPYEIIISNHSIEFVIACEKHKETNHFHAPMLLPQHAGSLERLNILVKKGLVSAEEVLDFAQKTYNKNLKIISYSLNEDNSEITIYSHAGIGLNNIEQLAEQFNISYRDATAVELAKTIDRINQKFKEHVEQGTVHTLCPKEAMNAAYGTSADLTKTPVVFAIWNRRYDLIDRPAHKNGYKLVYVHGHDSEDPEQEKTHVINLDENNNLGKLEYLNKGTYRVLTTDINPMKLVENFNIASLQQKINKEITRLNETTKDKKTLLVSIGIIEASDTKIEALKELDMILQNIAASGNEKDEFYSKLWHWKKINEACISKQRNVVHSFFFPDHRPKAAFTVDEIFNELGFMNNTKP